MIENSPFHDLTQIRDLGSAGSECSDRPAGFRETQGQDNICQFVIRSSWCEDYNWSKEQKVAHFKVAKTQNGTVFKALEVSDLAD